jgi:hypothetical protein
MDFQKDDVVEIKMRAVVVDPKSVPNKVYVRPDNCANVLVPADTLTLVERKNTASTDKPGTIRKDNDGLLYFREQTGDSWRCIAIPDYKYSDTLNKTFSHAQMVNTVIAGSLNIAEVSPEYIYFYDKGNPNVWRWNSHTDRIQFWDRKGSWFNCTSDTTLAEMRKLNWVEEKLCAPRRFFEKSSMRWYSNDKGNLFMWWPYEEEWRESGYLTVDSFLTSYEGESATEVFDPDWA